VVVVPTAGADGPVTRRMSADVAVIIVSFQSREHIAACLDSLREGQGKIRVIVVDNASSDGTPQLVRERFSDVTLVTLPQNVGFAAGVNRGIGECPDARFFFLVNPDSVVMPSAIPKMVSFAEEHPEVGILGPRVFDDRERHTVQRSCRQFPTLATAFFNRHSLLGKLFKGNRFSRSYLYLDEDSVSPRTVDWVSGCAMLFRHAVVESVGPFDGGFFFFCEDIDYCWRAHKIGWKVMYLPETSVVHLSGKSAEHLPYRILIEKHHSMLRLYRKHIRKTFLTDPIVVGGGWLRLGMLLAHARMRRRR